MPSFAGFVQLLRPVRLVYALVGVLAGAVLALGEPTIPPELYFNVAASAISAALLAAGGSVLDAIFDSDSVQSIDGSMTSGRVSLASARMTWAFCSLAAIVLAVLISWIHFLMAVAVTGLLYGQSARFRRMPILGSVVTGFFVGLTLVYGGLATGHPGYVLIGAVYAFLTMFSREIILDVEAVDQHRAAGYQTAPIVFGVGRSMTVAVSTLLLTIALTPLPFLALDYGPLFLLIVLVADLFLLRCIWLSVAWDETKGSASVWLNSAMVIGLAALLTA